MKNTRFSIRQTATLEDFKTEIGWLMIFTALYLPFSIIISLKGNYLHLFLSSVMSGALLTIEFRDMFTKENKPTPIQMRPQRKQEIRHPEIERIPVSSPFPFMNTNTEVKNETQANNDVSVVGNDAVNTDSVC